MHRIDTEGHADGLFQDGTPQIGQQGTILDADWLNDLQENLCGVVEAGFDGGGAPLVLAKGDHGQLLEAIQSLIDGAAGAARVRPGIIEIFGGGEAPDGYLECDGALVSRTTYADLFAAIGTIFGVGDGATTFALPDLRGEFVRGWDHGRGIDAARERGSAQTDMLKSHTHSVTPPAATDDTSSGATTTGSGGGETITPYNTASSGGTETRPRNVALMMVIKT